MHSDLHLSKVLGGCVHTSGSLALDHWALPLAHRSSLLNTTQPLDTWCGLARHSPLQVDGGPQGISP